MNSKLVTVLASVCFMLLGCDVETTGKTYRVQISAETAKSLVYETSIRGEIVLLELYSDKIMFTALIDRRKFEEVRTLKPPTYFTYKDSQYVKNDIFFWGSAGKPESVSVDDKIFEGFFLENGSQISAEGKTAQAVMEQFRSGKYLKLETHYLDNDQQKKYPIFDISSVKDDLPKLNPSSASYFVVNDNDTRCIQVGSRKIVWIETSAGSFALNGQALGLLRSRRSDGYPWLDSDNRPLREGRDVLGRDVTAPLIKAGLTKCENN